MKILGFDSSSNAATVAIADENKVIGEFFVNTKKNHSQKLLPLIDKLLKETDLKISDLSGIAVSVGPGSFTGLRIGVSTAKGLAYSTGLPIIGVNTLDGLAHNVLASQCTICPVLNARRSQVYTAIYKEESEEIIRISEYMAIGIDGLINKLSEIKSDEQIVNNYIFLGDGFLEYEKEIRKKLEGRIINIEKNNEMPRASSIALLGLKKLKEGNKESAIEIMPFYLRKSQAEIMLEKKGKESDR